MIWYNSSLDYHQLLFGKHIPYTQIPLLQRILVNLLTNLFWSHSSKFLQSDPDLHYAEIEIHPPETHLVPVKQVTAAQFVGGTWGE